MSQSFFEISGEIIACELDETERLYGRPSPTGLSSLIMMDTETPEGFSRSQKQPAGSAGGLSLSEAIAIPGRLRRATTAATWAGTLALADGPLPIGDALAVGLLSAYAVYEISLIYRDWND